MVKFRRHRHLYTVLFANHHGCLLPCMSLVRCWRNSEGMEVALSAGSEESMESTLPACERFIMSYLTTL